MVTIKLTFVEKDNESVDLEVAREDDKSTKNESLSAIVVQMQLNDIIRKFGEKKERGI